MQALVDRLVAWFDRLELIDRPAMAGVAVRDAAAVRAPRAPSVRGFARIDVERFLKGGALADSGRLPRYFLSFSLAAAAIWVPIATYLRLAPIRFTSQMSLILPGAGVSTSVNLSDIGQATSSANSPYSSPSLSPTVLYKNLLESYGVIERAAKAAAVDPGAFGKPVVKLVDETSLLEVDLSARTPEEAHTRAEALLAALSSELDKLRDDEVRRREASATDTVKEYQDKVDAIRSQITALQSQSGLNSSEQYASIVSGTETLRAHVADLRASLREKEANVASLSATLGIEAETAALTLKAQADPELVQLSQLAAKTASDVAAVEKQYGARHPKLADARAQALGAALKLRARGVAVTGLSLDDFERAIQLNPTGERAALLSKLVTLVEERDGLAAQVATQSAQLEQTTARVASLVETAARLDTLNRDYKVADAVFASALARINTGKTDIFASYPMVQVAEPPSMPERPSSPNKIVAAAAGVAATLFVAIGLLLAWMRRPLIDRALARRESAHG